MPPYDAGELRTYLRLLDAEQAGASQDEMAAVLYPDLPNDPPDYQGRLKVQESLTAAKRLRDGEYLDIIRKGVVPPKKKHP